MKLGGPSSIVLTSIDDFVVVVFLPFSFTIATAALIMHRRETTSPPNTAMIIMAKLLKVLVLETSVLVVIVTVILGLCSGNTDWN